MKEAVEMIKRDLHTINRVRETLIQENLSAVPSLEISTNIM